MTDRLWALAIICLVFGPPLALRPYDVARFGEAMDAIGRKPSGPVEPTEAKVRLTKGVGVALTLAGVAGLALAA